MFDGAYRKRLGQDLERWVERGWVRPEAMVAILEDQARDDGRSRLPMALAGIGMVLVALAVLAFIAANWDAIPKLAKLIGIALAIAAGHGFAAREAARGARGIADLLTGFSTLMFVGGLALVGQIFHLPQDWAGGALLVCFGGLAAAWLAGSRASLTVAAVAAITWQVMRPEAGVGLDNAGLGNAGLLGAVLLIAVAAHAVVWPARLSRTAAICLLWVAYGRWIADVATLADTSDDIMTAMVLAGAGGLAAVMLQLDPVADLVVKWSSDLPARRHGHWLMARALQDAGMAMLTLLIVLALVFVPEISDTPAPEGLLAAPAFLPLVLALVLCAAGLLLSFKTAKARMLFAATGLALAAVLLPLFAVSIPIVAATGLAALVALCALGTWFGNRVWMLCAYLGLTAVMLWLLEVTVGSLLGQSLFFLVAGLVLLAMALWLARLMRRGAARLPEAAPPPAAGPAAQEGEGHP